MQTPDYNIALQHNTVSLFYGFLKRFFWAYPGKEVGVLTNSKDRAGLLLLMLDVLGVTPAFLGLTPQANEEPTYPDNEFDVLSKETEVVVGDVADTSRHKRGINLIVAPSGLPDREPLQRADCLMDALPMGVPLCLMLMTSLNLDAPWGGWTGNLSEPRKGRLAAPGRPEVIADVYLTQVIYAATAAAGIVRPSLRTRYRMMEITGLPFTVEDDPYCVGLAAYSYGMRTPKSHGVGSRMSPKLWVPPHEIPLPESALEVEDHEAR